MNVILGATFRHWASSSRKWMFVGVVEFWMWWDVSSWILSLSTASILRHVPVSMKINKIARLISSAYHWRGLNAGGDSAKLSPCGKTRSWIHFSGRIVVWVLLGWGVRRVEAEYHSAWLMDLPKIHRAQGHFRHVYHAEYTIIRWKVPCFTTTLGGSCGLFQNFNDKTWQFSSF